MAPITLVFGVILILLSGGAYFGGPTQSPTALIPAAFGLVFLILGGLAFKDNLRKHVMHGAAMLGLIGFLMPGIMALPKVPTLIAEGKVLRADGSDATFAILVQVAMAVICLVFVGLCVNSFIQARRRRNAAVTQA